MGKIPSDTKKFLETRGINIEQIKLRGPTVAEEASQIDAEIQKETMSSLTATKKILLIAGGTLFGYLLLVIIFTAFFSLYPIQTAKWFGFAENNDGVRVLGVQASSTRDIKSSPIQTVLQPVGRVSLGLVKNINPESYKQVSKFVILDPNDVLTVDANGTIIPDQPISLPESSLLQIGSSQLVANLNSQYVQGLEPGTDEGDIAVVGEVGTPGTYGGTASIPIITTDSQGRVLGAENTPISGLTAASFGSTVISQWVNDLSYVTAATLSNSGLGFAGNNGSGNILLGEILTIAGGGINTATYSNGTITIFGTEADTLASITERGAATTTPITLSTVNGLTITNNGGNTLNIAADKTFTLSNSLIFTGTDATSFVFPAFSDDIVGRTAGQTLTNKTIAAGSNSISGLTNSNLSGTAAITNANLANSSLTVTAGTGLTGGGLVALGGSISLTNSGVTSLTGTTNQVNVSSTTGNITLTLPQNIHTGASPTFAGLTLTGLTNCGALATNSSGLVLCDGATGDTASFTDTNPATTADNNTTELFDDATKPSITPNTTSQTVLVTVNARFTGGGGADTYIAVRVVRNNGSAASCSTGTQVGDTFSAFVTSPDVVSTDATFLDSPSSTGQVFYTICSSANSNLGSTPVSNRVDITLVELGG